MLKNPKRPPRKPALRTGRGYRHACRPHLPGRRRERRERTPDGGGPSGDERQPGLGRSSDGRPWRVDRHCDHACAVVLAPDGEPHGSAERKPDCGADPLPDGGTDARADARMRAWDH